MGFEFIALSPVPATDPDEALRHFVNDVAVGGPELIVRNRDPDTERSDSASADVAHVDRDGMVSLVVVPATDPGFSTQINILTARGDAPDLSSVRSLWMFNLSHAYDVELAVRMARVLMQRYGAIMFDETSGFALPMS